MPLISLDDAITQAQEKPAAYVLLGSDGSYLYKGACRNLHERLKDHHAGRASRTKNRRPLGVVLIEYFDDYSGALRREAWLKSGVGREFIHGSMPGR